MVPNQGLQAIAFFEATACLTLLVLFIHLKRDNATAFYKLWLLGWVCLTLSSFSELAMLFTVKFAFRLVVSGADMAALVLFLASIVGADLEVEPLVLAGAVAGRAAGADHLLLRE